jgi:hypothetical protein
MSGFDPAWLALREPYDHAARDAPLAERFATALGAAPELVDLGCGTGSNPRYLAPRLGADQRWLCLDHDHELLQAGLTATAQWAEARGCASSGSTDVLEVSSPEFSLGAQFHVWDLTRGLPENVSPRAVLAAAALLDLTSAVWLDALATRHGRRPMLFTLSFDGRLEFRPRNDEFDLEITRRFVAHQRTDKGFGPALGPDAADHLAERLQKAGRRVTLRHSDWRLGPVDRPLLEALLEGLIGAARAVADDQLLEYWASERRRELQAGELSVTVGHLDLLSLPG